MKLWMSGEIQADVDSAYMKARNVVQTAVNGLLAAVSIPDKIEEWDFIAIIREEDSPDYNEVAKKISQGQRVRVPSEGSACRVFGGKPGGESRSDL
jgi:hypothetical protein